MNLKAIRVQLGLTQEELAEKAGVSRVMISMYETGAAKPSEKTRAVLCKAFGVAEELLDGTEDELLAAVAGKLSFLCSISSALSCGDKKQKKVLAGVFADACKELSDIAQKLCEVKCV